MSRSQWWSLTALLAVVMGLLCGPAAGAAPASSDAVREAAAVSVAALPVTAVPVDAPPAAAAIHPASGAVADTDSGIPGCGAPSGHDSEPALPSRARAAHDQAPGLTPWGLPAATGAPRAEPPAAIPSRAPVPSTPTPVELSVLRV
ncbi:hypothetical protein [Streptomyces sp. NPDC101181]|uniref:hypothetical protein n=1 Tax=Streptomyces sp. NPDC101181 TaxID=3366125 RepID=UPI003818F8BC